MFDVVITNPPFGAKIPVVGKELLSSYQLGHYWQNNENNWNLTDQVRDKQPPQILFIEKCMNLLKDGGRMAIVLPEGIFGNPSDRYVWEYLNKISDIFGIVSLNQEVFNQALYKDISIIFKKSKQIKEKIFMSICKDIGHNKNGKTLYKTDTAGEFILNKEGSKSFPTIYRNYKLFLKHLNNGKVSRLARFSIRK